MGGSCHLDDYFLYIVHFDNFHLQSKKYFAFQTYVTLARLSKVGRNLKLY